MVPFDKSEDMNLDKEIESSVDALMKLLEPFKGKKTLLDTPHGLFLQVTLFKVPNISDFIRKKITLKHPVHSKQPEICFIVPDVVRRNRLKLTIDELIDISVDKYQEHFKKLKIEGVSKILPFLQLKNEYNTYELKRKLVNQFDIFLCHSYLYKTGKIYDHLGKPFTVKNKFPICVFVPGFRSQESSKGKDNVEKALLSTLYYQKPGSENYSIKFGSTEHNKSELIENLQTLVNKLMTSDHLIPGGFKNIRSLLIKSEKSKAIPLYMSLSSGNDVPVPDVVDYNASEPIDGDISTLPGKKVTVYPDGEVLVNDVEGDFDISDFDEDDNEAFEEAENQEVEEKLKKPIKKDEDDGEMDDAIELAEQKYLSQLDDAFESSEDEKEKEVETKKNLKRKSKDQKERKNSKKEKISKKKKALKVTSKNKKSKKSNG